MHSKDRTEILNITIVKQQIQYYQVWYLLRP